VKEISFALFHVKRNDIMSSTRAGNKRLLRDLNQSRIFNLIVERGPISRTDLAKHSGLPAATITRIVSNFLAASLVSEMPSEQSSGGRRPVLLQINPSSGYAVGVKLREDSMTIAACDLQCTIKHTLEQPITGEAEPYRVVNAIVEGVKRCLEEAGIDIRQVMGVGVGLSGLVDSAKGICRYSAILDWHDVELGAALEYKLRLPVRIDNDVNTLAVAERHFGAGRDADNFLLVTVGRGIGLGIVVGGEIYRGTHWGAGEFGHMTVDTSADASLCNCGKRGCLEAIASDYGILRAATGRDPGHHVEDTIGTLLDRARAGDAPTQAIFAQAGKTLGVAIANLINIFDPASVLLSGEGLQAGDLFLESLQATIPLHTFGPSRENIAFVLCPTDDSSWACGAASLILREVLQPPIYENEEALVIDDLLTRSSNHHRRKEESRKA
jgi:N-acetylglucosamine repressor